MTKINKNAAFVHVYIKLQQRTASGGYDEVKSSSASDLAGS